MRSGQVALPEGFGYWLVKFDGLEGNGDKEGGLFIFFERHPVPDAFSFFPVFFVIILVVSANDSGVVCI